MRKITPQMEEEQMVDDLTPIEIQVAINRLSGAKHKRLRVAVMTAIAQGNRQDLEQQFPELAGANPENWDWP